jgi:hypothetical protein
MVIAKLLEMKPLTVEGVNILNRRGCQVSRGVIFLNGDNAYFAFQIAENVNLY